MMRKRVLCILLSVIMTLSMMPMMAYAEGSYKIAVDEDANAEWIDVLLGGTYTFTLTDDFLIVTDGEGNVIGKDDPAYPENILDELCYQWYKDEDKIKGATGTSYTTEICKRSELNSTFTCYIYNKKSDGNRGKKIGEFYFFLSEDTMERFTVDGGRYRANTNVNMDDTEIATIGDSCSLDAMKWFKLQKWNGNEWQDVAADDKHWSCSWKSDDKRAISNTKPVYTIKNVKESDIQTYKVYVAFGNKKLGSDEITVEKDTSEYFKIDGIKYRGYVDCGLYTVDTKIGTKVTLDPEQDRFDEDDFYHVEQFLSDKECPEGCWRDVEGYAADSSFEWTREDSTKVLATTKKLKINVTDSSAYGIYYLNIKYRGHYIGRETFDVEEDHRTYIGIGGGTYQRPKKGDLMANLDNTCEEICAVEGQRVLLSHIDPEFVRYDGNDWYYYLPTGSKLHYSWTKNGVPLKEYKASYIYLDVADNDLGSVYKCKITYDKYKVGTCEYTITEGLGLDENAQIIGHSYATQGERVKLIAQGEPNKKGAKISYQWYAVNYDFDRFLDEEEYTVIPGATERTYVTEPLEMVGDSGYYAYCCKYTVHDEDQRLADYTDEYYTDILVGKDSNITLKTGIPQKVKLDSGITYRFTFTPAKSGWYGFEVSDVNWIDMIGVQAVETENPEEDFHAIAMDDERGYKAKLDAGTTYYVYAYGYSEDPDRDYTEFNLVAKKRKTAGIKKKTITLKRGKKYNPDNNLKGEKDLHSYYVKSSNKKVVKVVGSKLKALKKGSSRITLYTDEGKFTYKIKVKK